MSDTQYAVYLLLFNECNDDFWHLPDKTKDAFFDRLYSR